MEGQPDVFHFSQRTDNEYSFIQTIPFPTKLILRGQLALREAQMAYQRYKEEERSVIWHLEQPYYELYLTKKTLGALRDIRALFEKLSTEHLRASLALGQQHCLKARQDGTMLDGHHRVQILKRRGENVDALPREIVQRLSL